MSVADKYAKGILKGMAVTAVGASAVLGGVQAKGGILKSGVLNGRAYARP